MFYGPLAAVAFTIGSCVGYVLASLYYLRTSMQEALSAFELYPKLMIMHMAHNYTTYGFDRIRMESEADKVLFRERLRTSLTMRCFMLSSYHTAAPAIDVGSSSVRTVGSGGMLTLRAGDQFEARGGFDCEIERRRRGAAMEYSAA